MSRNAHASTTLLVQRDLERRQSNDWYECHQCGAHYQSANARVMCCSGDAGGDSV